MRKYISVAFSHSVCGHLLLQTQESSLGDRHLHTGGSRMEQEEKVNADTFTILVSADPTGNLKLT